LEDIHTKAELLQMIKDFGAITEELGSKSDIAAKYRHYF
jgi:hypothetical protein